MPRRAAHMDWDEIVAVAAASPAFGSLVDPNDQSFFNPADMEQAIVDFCRKTGQVVPSNRGAFVRLVYESLALKYRMVNEEICRVCGLQTKVVHVVGGGCRNRMLNQFTANAMGLPVLAGPEEATAVGNLMVQAVGQGIIDTLADSMPLISSAFPITKYTPENVAAWEEVYERFEQIHLQA
jgi:rhamnulokinase